jgi:hypothetical protein
MRIKRIGFGYRNFENNRICDPLYAGKPDWRVLGSIVDRRAVRPRQNPKIRSVGAEDDNEKARRGTATGNKPPRSPRPTGTDRPGPTDRRRPGHPGTKGLRLGKYGSQCFDQVLYSDFPGSGVSIPSGSLTFPPLSSR